MKRIKDIRFIFIVVVLLVVAMACGQTAAPASSPSEGVESAAAQASVDPVDEAETPADAPDIVDFMDEATAKQFEEMTDEWQTMVKDGWVGITEFAPREDWAEAAQDAVSQSYANAKTQGGLRGIPVANVQDIVDPSKGASPDGTGTTPFVLSLLSPGYTEAYNLIPEGSLMREYLDIELGSYSEKGWELVKAQPDEPYPVPAPKLDAGDELELRQVLTSAGDAEWLVQRLRSLDAGAAKQFEAAKEVTERLSVFRKLVEVEGKEQGVAEILAEWGARSNGWDEEEIAAHIERTRIWAAENEARSRMTPRQGYINHVESTLCGDLMSYVVGQEPRTANSSPAQCDIAKVITLTKEALEAGQKASSDQQIREAIEVARQTPGQSDPPNIADFMDAATARLFEQMNDEWQEMARNGWVNITTKFAPQHSEDWKDAAQSMISQMYPQAKIQGGIRRVPVAGVQDLVDPGKGATSDGTTPFVLSLLSPGYTEAYDLIPEGSLMREYLDIRLGRFKERGWESIKAQPDEPYPVPAPKLDAGDEFELRRVLTSSGDAEWLVQKLRSIDADAAKQYEATQDVTERLAVFRKLVEVDGKGQGVEEIRAEWGARSNGWSEDEIAAHIERTRIWAAEKEARSRMTARQGYINHVESTLCGDLMSHIVGQEPRSANSGPAQCDIAKVIALTKEALQGGQKASSDQQLREAIEVARQNQGQ